MQTPYTAEVLALEEALMKTVDELSQKHQSKAAGRINLEVAIAATSATQAKQGAIQQPIRSNQCYQSVHLGQQAPLPSYLDIPRTYMQEMSNSNTRPVEMERLINPLSVRFSIESMSASFQDGSSLQDALSDIQTLPGDGDEYDIILNAPFPSIQIFRGSTLDSTDHWYTLDNHRLYCLQCAAIALWPARVAAYVAVPVGADTASWPKICYKPGTSVSFQEFGVYQNQCLGHWDWQSEVQRISLNAAATASITPAHVFAALAVGKDCAKESENALQEDAQKTPRLNSDAGSDSGKASTATRSTTASDRDDSEGSVPSSPKLSEGSKCTSPNFGPSSDAARPFESLSPPFKPSPPAHLLQTLDQVSARAPPGVWLKPSKSHPEIVEECRPIAISLAAAVSPMEKEKQIAPKNTKVKDETGKQAKSAKKKDAEKQFKDTPALSTVVPAEEVTTLMIRGIPCSFTQEGLIALLHDAGLKDQYDFFYMPRDGKKNTNLGYAFVNLVDVQSAEHCTAKFQGVQLDPFRSPKTCRVSPANIQGLPGLWNHFRSTAVKAGQNGPVFLPVKEEFRNQKSKAAKNVDAWQ